MPHPETTTKILLKIIYKKVKKKGYHILNALMTDSNAFVRCRVVVSIVGQGLLKNFVLLVVVLGQACDDAMPSSPTGATDFAK